MNTITYEFIADPGVRLKRLFFESSVSGLPLDGDNKGTKNINITNLLEIHIKCEGKKGDRWALYVNVDTYPILTAPISGRIIGIIPDSGKSEEKGGYLWRLNRVFPPNVNGIQDEIIS